MSIYMDIYMDIYISLYMDIYISLYMDIYISLYIDIYMDIYTHSKEPRSMVAHLPRVKKTLIALTKTMSHTQST